MPTTLSTRSTNSHPPSTYSQSRSLFPQAPSFTLETFSDRDFIVKDFVEALSDSTIPPNRRSGPSQSNAFDPKPLIRSFEHAVNRMSDLSGDLEIRENELSGAVRRAEAQHTANVQNLERRLEQTVDSFNRLDSSLNGNSYENGGQDVVKIGERLEELERQRQRALDAKFLIQCWMEVSERGELFLLEDIRRQGGGDGKVRCAQIARQLSKISQRLDTESWAQTNGNGKLVNGVNGESDHKRRHHNTRELIEKFSETLEKDLLKSFDDFYRRQNFDGMRDCANVLYDFNSGASVIAAFVNQHDFFIQRSQLITAEVAGDAETWERLADPDAEPPGVEPTLQSLVDEVEIVMQEESLIIKRAFPYADQVLGKFLQRVFQQSIQQRLEMVLEKANTVSSLAFLRSLQAARSCLSTLIDNLKAHGLTEHPEPVSPQIAMILDQQFDDLFVPYFVGSSYIEREKRSLEELYSSLLFKFTIFHSRRRKIPTTFMKSLAKSGSEMLASARDAYVERLDSSDLAPAQKARLLRVAGLKDSENAKTQTEIEVTEQDGVLSVDNAKRMLKWLAEAVGRGLELSGGNETAKDVYAMLNLLLSNLGELYVETALDSANDIATSQETTKNEPDLSYLIGLRSAIGILHLMNTCIRTVLIPLASANVTIRRDMEKTANLAMDQMEEKINAIMQKSIDVVISWVSKLLARQLKTDFRPRDDALGEGEWLEQLQTPTCSSISTFLTRFHTLTLTALSPTSPNLTSLLTELALQFRSLLFEHFKKFSVNATGGIMVTKDISKYNELLRSWNLPEETFASTFEVLTEIGNLFVIGPDALKERLRGRGGGGAWERSDMRPYVLRREDAGSVGVQSVLSAL
ncbi:Exocyst complex component 5 [Lecanora helva]